MCRTFFVLSHRVRDKSLFVSQRVAGGEKRSDVKIIMSDVEKTTSDIVFFNSDIIFRVIRRCMATPSSATPAGCAVFGMFYSEIAFAVYNKNFPIS